jgi:hypothetical protein
MSLRRIRPLALLTVSLLAATALPAAAQSTVDQQDTSNSRFVAAVDPFSPFVYDALGATPTLRLRAAKCATASAVPTTGQAVVQSSEPKRCAPSGSSAARQAPTLSALSEPTALQSERR